MKQRQIVRTEEALKEGRGELARHLDSVEFVDVSKRPPKAGKKPAAEEGRRK